jgi:hypothetical protein
MQSPRLLAALALSLPPAFAASQAPTPPVAPHAPATLQLLTTPPVLGAPFAVKVQIDGQPMTLRLMPHSVRSQQFRLLVSDGAQVFEHDPAPSSTYRGWVDEIPGARLVASVDQRGMKALLRIGGEQSDVWIEPADVAGDTPGKIQHFVRRSDEMPAFSWGSCASTALRSSVPTSPGSRTPATGGPSPVGSGSVTASAAGGNFGLTSVQVCELACDSDVELFAFNGGSVIATTDYIESRVNFASLIFEEELNTVFSINAIIVRVAEPDPYPVWTSIFPVAGDVQTEWSTNQAGIPRDTVLFASGKGVGADGYIGLGQVSSLCAPQQWSNCVNLPEGVPLSFALQVKLFCHELGHVFGACHCDAPTCSAYDLPSCDIMSSGLGATGNMQFGASSAAQINAFLSGVTCLSTGTGSAAPTLSSIQPTQVDVLGGTTLTLSGQNVDTATLVDVNGTQYDLLEYQLVNNQTITCIAPRGSALGPVGVRLSGPGGQSAVQRFGYVETNPPRLLTESATPFPQETITWNFGSWAGLQADVMRSLDSSVTMVNGWPVLTNGSTLQTVTLDAVGLGTASELNTLGTGVTFWMQAVIRNGTQVVGSTNIVQHVVQ